jgi:hypothetical protein
MRKILFVLVCLLAASAARAQTTYTAASCSSTDVQTKVNLTSDGDIVIVPSGTCSWTGHHAVVITTGITLQGAGAGSTTINWTATGTDPGYNGVLAITAGTGATFQMTGFTFQGAFTNGSYPIEVDTAFSPITKTFRIHDVTLNYVGGGGGAGTILGINGNGPGLIDHTTWTTDQNGSELIHNLSEGYGNTTAWAEDVLPGDSRALFIEDNSFYYTPGGNTSVSFIENFYGARVVLRHNHVYMGAFDVHGGPYSDPTHTCNNPPAYVNGRWWEEYDNDFHTSGTSPNSFAWIIVRGGSGIVFDNTDDNAAGQGAGAIDATSDCQASYSGGYPVPQQVGRGIGGTTHASPAYFWNNKNTATGANMPFQDLEGTGWVQVNRDYYTSASQPATLTRCESAADVSAGCPVSYVYTPYVYPHPLNSGITLSPGPTVAFGSQNTGTTSAATTVTVTNNSGSSVTTGSSAYYSITGTNFGDFVRSGGGGTPCTTADTLTPTSSCTIQITFSPAAAGARSARLNILGSSGAVIGSADLTGTGATPGGGSNKVNLATEVKNTLPCANMPALTGDVTSSAGSCATTIAGAGGTKHGLSFTIYNSAGLAAATSIASTDYLTIPFGCTIDAYNLEIDAGTITVKFWKKATGTAIPTSSDSINTSGVQISTGTAIHSTTLSDFTTTTVNANDIMAMNITAVSTAQYVNGVISCHE